MAQAEQPAGYDQSSISCCSASIRVLSYEDIRIAHAKTISEMDLDGYAVGGLAVGETHEEMYHILDASSSLPATGQADLSDGCRYTGQYSGGSRPGRGLSSTVCTRARNGRHGHVYTNHGQKRNLFNAKYELDQRPIEEGCRLSGLPEIYSRGLYPTPV